MHYKVGDEVWVKGKITRTMNMGVLVNCTCGEAFVHEGNIEDVLIPADKTYTQGLADSWNLLKKVYDMKCETIEQIFDVEGGFWDVIRDFTYEEALAKIEAYEKEKEIKVGDVVRRNENGFNGVVTAIKHGEANVMYDDGSSSSWSVKNLIKTGKHIDIDSLLRQIGE